MEREARSQAGCADTVTQGPLAQLEGIPSGREEMSPSHSGDFCQRHSPFSSVSTEPTLLTLVLVLLPKPAY